MTLSGWKEKLRCLTKNLYELAGIRQIHTSIPIINRFFCKPKIICWFSKVPLIGGWQFPHFDFPAPPAGRPRSSLLLSLHCTTLHPITYSTTESGIHEMVSPSRLPGGFASSHRMGCQRFLARATIRDTLWRPVADLYYAIMAIARPPRLHPGCAWEWWGMSPATHPVTDPDEETARCARSRK